MRGLIMILLSLCTMNAQAQYRWTFGVQSGVSPVGIFTSITPKLQRELALPKKKWVCDATKWHIGGFVEMFLVAKLAMRVEANYEYILGNSVDYYYHINPKLSYWANSHLLTAPIIFSYKPNKIFALDMGLEPIWTISMNYKFFVDPETNPYNLAALLGIGFAFGDHFRWNIGVRYLLLPVSKTTLYGEAIRHLPLKGHFSVAYLFRPWG